MNEGSVPQEPAVGPRGPVVAQPDEGLAAGPQEVQRGGAQALRGNSPILIPDWGLVTPSPDVPTGPRAATRAQPRDAPFERSSAYRASDAAAPPGMATD